jgi:putative transposase
MRARIILMAGAGRDVRETARELDIGRASEGQPFAERLCDAPRAGAPPTFEPEQICEIIALACEPPSQSGWSLTHWTHEALATAASEGGILESISARLAPRRTLSATPPRCLPRARPKPIGTW